MKSLFISTLILALGSSALGFDIHRARSDFRIEYIGNAYFERLLKESTVMVDTSRLLEEEILRKKFPDSLFGAHYEKVDDSTELGNFLTGFLHDKIPSGGDLFKPASTRIKVIKKTEIYLFIAAKALVSNLVLEPGDLVLIQNMGDLL